MTSSDRKLLYEHIIQPGTGKALEMQRGQILRIAQTSGRQCADFNCFNLHDYKEFFHTGRTRHLHGLHPTTGDFLWSAPPRERPMMAIIEDTVAPTTFSIRAAAHSCLNISMVCRCTRIVTISRQKRSANTG